MRQVKQKQPADKSLAPFMQHRLREGVFILSIAAALFLLISFFSWQPSDPGWLGTGMGQQVLNRGGRAGAFLADVLLFLFGAVAWFLPFLVVFLSWSGLRPAQAVGDDKPSLLVPFFRSLGALLLVGGAAGLVALLFRQPHPWLLPASTGGLLGEAVASLLRQVFSTAGSLLFLGAAFLTGMTLLTGFSWLSLTDRIGMRTVDAGAALYQWLKKKIMASRTKPALPREKEPSLRVVAPPKPPAAEKPAPVVRVTPPEKTMTVSPMPRPEPPREKREKRDSAVSLSFGMLPPLTLLDPPVVSNTSAFTDTSYEELSKLVEQRLLDFGVSVKVVAVRPGPIITRFELELAPGIKVSKISGLAKDIARSLMVTSVRIVEVIPGKSAIGLEIPNQHRDPVSLRDILESPRFSQAKSPVSLVLGKDIAGCPVVVDLAKMPHLLVAGTTGSGKSVSINAMLLSMLFKATPEQLRLILIDPKMLELSIYEGIPHLLTPVITDMKDAANALRWCVAEMDKRYRLMAFLGVRNLAGYNAKITEAERLKKPLSAPEWLKEGDKPVPHLTVLPAIVVVADELADMMMVVGKKVEDLIARIAQKARASGIHLILATQRPSVDVITGLIKANIPTRISFQVSSRIDSRTILDQQGAEQLLGYGDMLYLPPGTGMPVRIHGAFVADDEVHRVVAAWQTYGKPVYLDEVTGDTETSASGSDDGETDPLYDQALQIVTESRRASISLIQRRLKIGYNRAARLMESMEAAGVVSTMDTNGSREVIAPPPI